MTSERGGPHRRQLVAPGMGLIRGRARGHAQIHLTFWASAGHLEAARGRWSLYERGKEGTLRTGLAMFETGADS